MRFIRLSILCLIPLLVCSSRLSAEAQEADRYAAARQVYEKWRQPYSACFDRNDRPVPQKLRAFVAMAEEQRAANHGTATTMEELAILTMLSQAYGSLGQWEKAEGSDLASISLIEKIGEQGDDSQTQEVSWFRWYREQTNRDLAQVYGAQHNWTIAIRYYLWYLRLHIEQNYVSGTEVAYGLLALWGLIGWRIPTLRAPRRHLFWLALFAGTPLAFLFLNILSRLLTCSMLYGNPFFGPLSSRLTPVSLVQDTLWPLLLIWFAIRFRKTHHAHERASIEEERPTKLDSVTPTIAPAKWRQSVFLVAVTLIGWALQHINYERWGVNATLHLPESIAWWRNSGQASASWIFDTVFKITVGSWVEELYFRGVVYHYARQVLGVGFAVVFSSIVFAAWHAELQQFNSYFWIGIVFAVQYEVSASLIPSTVSHCAHNMLVFLTPRP